LPEGQKIVTEMMSTPYPMLQNRLKQRLAAKEVALCMRTILARNPEISFMAQAAGFDAMYMDLEHCTASLDLTVQICATATAIGLPALVRIPVHDDPNTTKLLDGGAVGIIAPHVDTADQARLVVNACKFPPLGTRSASGPAFQLGYAQLPLNELAERLNEATFVAVMLETAAAIENAESIAAVDGVDMLLIGTTDLSLQLGIPGQHAAAPIVAAYEKVATACARRGKALGIAGVSDPEIIARYLGMGARFVSAGTDAGFFLEAAKARTEQMRNLTA
jgi:2-keto-3-deoxy-L-rhamnonate aldolase RhmA